MGAAFDLRGPDLDPIRQLESDLKQVGELPQRFPRTVKLRNAGPTQHAKKVIEEAAELAIEALRKDKDATVREAADLVYNLVVLLEGVGADFDDVCSEMARRRAIYGIAAKQQKNGLGLTESSPK